MTRSLILSILVCACGGEAPERPHAPAEDVCVAPEGLGSPQTIPDALDLIDALPAPVTVPCVIQALDRPLRVQATRGTISAQPAASVESPRIFVLSGHLTLSIVPDGRGRDLLEFGQSDGVGQSIKGELIMPVQTPVAAGKPYDHLRYNEQVTVCGLCHQDERLAPQVGHPNAYISRAFRPLPREVVDLETVRAEAEACDPRAEPERCAVLAAVFDHGEVEAAQFPDYYGTIVRP